MRRSTRHGSTSMQRATPPLPVTASGCAPPMPPRPPVTVIVPASEGTPTFAASVKCWLATSAKVAKVPCRMPWVPM